MEYKISTIITLALIVLAIIFLLVQYIRKNSLEKIRNDVYQLFIQVEHAYEHGDNQKKIDTVIEIARELLPKWTKPFITEKFVRATIQLWFIGIKDLLDDGKINDSGKGTFDNGNI